METAIKINNDILEIKKVMAQLASYAGHLTSSLSSLEILYSLYTTININRDNLDDIKNCDLVIISKEHARLAQVCVLAQLGLIDKKLLNGYIKDGGLLGHDMYNVVGSKEISAVDYASGSLGHGAGVGIGFALANRKRNIYVIVGDGELQEGSLWEAFMFAIQYKLKNLIIIIDKNCLQIEEYTKNIIDSTSNIENKMSAFGFDIISCDGHNIAELKKAIQQETTNPKCIVASTIKGRGIEFLLKEVGFPIFHHSSFCYDENINKRVYEALTNDE